MRLGCWSSTLRWLRRSWMFCWVEWGGLAEARELTDIEEAILTRWCRWIVQELNLAWQPVGLAVGLREARDGGQR